MARTPQDTPGQGGEAQAAPHSPDAPAPAQDGLASSQDGTSRLLRAPVTRRRKLNRRHRAQQLAATERRTQVWRLKVKQLSCRAIAKQVGVSAMQVSRDIRRELGKFAREEQRTAEEYRMLELADLNDQEAGLAVLRANQDGEPMVRIQATRESRRISESRRRLLGLDMPARTEISGPGGAPVAYDHLHTLSVADLQARLSLLAGQLAAVPDHPAPMEAEVLPAADGPLEAAKAAYKAELLGRNGHGGGNGSGA